VPQTLCHVHHIFPAEILICDPIVHRTIEPPPIAKLLVVYPSNQQAFDAIVTIRDILSVVSGEDPVIEGPEAAR